jgi:thioredoxin-like negative regulator of GroEL
MLTLLITAVLANFASSSPKTHDYNLAYQEAQLKGKPLMVIVGAQWCPACHTLKDTTIKELETSGQLNDVCVAVVDRDAEPQLAQQLMRGQMIPQIIVFAKGNSGRWERSQLTGFQQKGPVRQLILSAMSAIRRS